MSKLDLAEHRETDSDLIAKLYTLVMRVAHRIDDEGTERRGEVALYRDTGGCFAVQLRRRDGSTVEFGRHGSFREAISAAVGPEAPR